MASVGAGITRNVASRGVHVKVVPRPMNIAESREVLRLLSQFGEVEYFRNLRYDARPSPNSALAIFKDSHAAQRCILKSPLRFRMNTVDDLDGRDEETMLEQDYEGPNSATTDPAQRSPLAPQHQSEHNQSIGTPSSPRPTGAFQGAFGLQQTRSLNTDSLPKPPREPPTYPFHLRGMPEQQAAGRNARQEQETDKDRIYQMYINPSKVNFMSRIEMGHYHGGFENDWRSTPNDDLRKRTPLKGMANLNWRMKTKSATTIRTERQAMYARGRIGGLGEIYRAAQGKAASGD